MFVYTMWLLRESYILETSPEARIQLFGCNRHSQDGARLVLLRGAAASGRETLARRGAGPGMLGT